MKFLKSISKAIIMSFGSLSLLGFMGIGIVGKVYEKQAKDIYTKVYDDLAKEDEKKQTKFGKILQDVSNTIVNIKDLDVPKTYAEIRNNVNNLEDQSKNIEVYIKKLEDLKKAFLNSGKLNGLADSVPNISQEIDKVIQYLKELEKQVGGSIVLLKDTLSQYQGPMDQMFDPTNGLINYVDTTVQDVTKIYNDFAKGLRTVPPEKFDQYYGLTTTLLIAIPASVFAVGVIGWVLGTIMYKNVDGKLVSRAHAKKDLVKHIDKITKKYPDIKQKP